MLTDGTALELMLSDFPFSHLSSLFLLVYMCISLYIWRVQFSDGYKRKSVLQTYSLVDDIR